MSNQAEVLLRGGANNSSSSSNNSSSSSSSRRSHSHSIGDGSGNGAGGVQTRGGRTLKLSKGQHTRIRNKKAMEAGMVQAKRAGVGGLSRQQQKVRQKKLDLIKRSITHNTLGRTPS